jgi:flagellar motor switch protein FliN/FliY
VVDLAEAITRAEVPTEAGLVSLQLTSGDKSGVLYLLWPASKPDAVLDAVEAPAEEPAEESQAEDTAAEEAALGALQSEFSTSLGESFARGPTPVVHKRTVRRISQFEELPAYGRSLMHIKVPVVVTLAQQRLPVSHIVELGPGAILQFDKPCEEMLDLEIGDQPVAVGEAVKVGDKFGLRITSVSMPEERFIAVKGVCE